MSSSGKEEIAPRRATATPIEGLANETPTPSQEYAYQ